MEKLNHITLKNILMPVEYVETSEVKDGVVCDVYRFVGDASKDLAVVLVKKGFTTPRQLVLSGEHTTEHFVAGRGRLVVSNGQNSTEYSFPGNINEVEVFTNETMQWTADEDLIFYEICTPPYQDGRFENLD